MTVSKRDYYEVLSVSRDADDQTIKASFENFMQARALVAEARSQYWPQIAVGPSWNRSRSSANLRNSSQANTGTTSTLWSAPLVVHRHIM